jgi:hypothetical protein
MNPEHDRGALRGRRRDETHPERRDPQADTRWHLLDPDPPQALGRVREQAHDPSPDRGPGRCRRHGYRPSRQLPPRDHGEPPEGGQ